MPGRAGQSYSLDNIAVEGRRTNVSGNSGQDDLALSRVTNSLSEVRIIPSIDLTVPSDYWGVRVHFGDFLRQRSVRACLSACGEHNRNVKELGHGGVGDDVIPEFGRFKVPDLV